MNTARAGRQGSTSKLLGQAVEELQRTNNTTTAHQSAAANTLIRTFTFVLSFWQWSCQPKTNTSLLQKAYTPAHSMPL